ncbi:hypothetical protein [Stomatohabitans albus]|uniref:hypothetical protein n=1 Tax=Stomatohabitans albus TaxID=3110766 RepID=UPI00300CB3A4
MPVTLPQTALALSFCALTLLGIATPASAQAGDLASPRAYAATVTMNGPALTIGHQTTAFGSTSLQLANAPTADCETTACATLINPKVSTPFKVSDQPVSGSLPAIGLTEVRSGLRGESAPRQTTLTATTGTTTAEAQSVDVVLDEPTLNAVDPDIRGQLPDDLIKLASMLEPLATASGPGSLTDIHAAVQDLAQDPASRPFMRIRQGESTSSVDSKPQAMVTQGPAQVELFPTNSGHALIRVDIAASTLDATSPIGSSASGTITPGTMHVVLLPGLRDAIPASVGANTNLAGTRVAEILTQLPKAASGILGPRFNATDSALVLDEETGGLTIDVSPSTERACWFDSSVLETCVESGVGQRTLSANGAGVGMVAQPARMGLLRQNIVLDMHEAHIGVNADPTPDNQQPLETQDRTKPLPRTGSNLPPAWVLLLTALSSIGVLTVLRKRS